MTVRMTDNMLAYIEEQAADAGYPSGEAFMQALVMDHHSRRIAALQAAIDEGEASGYADEDGLVVFDRTIEAARERSGSHAS